VFSRCNTFLDFAEYEPEVMRWAEIDDPRGFAGQVLTSAAWRRDRMVHGLRFVEFPPLRRDATVEGFAERYRDLLRDQSVQRRTD
jgi:hypothetical protein